MVNLFGGPGSGFYGHAGRQGQIGGSMPSGSRSLSGKGSATSPQISKAANSKSTTLPSQDERNYFPGEEHAQSITGASIEDIHAALAKAYYKDPLTIRDMRILQAGWPDLYGKPGSKFRLPSQEEREDALSFDEISHTDLSNLNLARFAEVYSISFSEGAKLLFKLR